MHRIGKVIFSFFLFAIFAIVMWSTATASVTSFSDSGWLNWPTRPVSGRYGDPVAGQIRQQENIVQANSLSGDSILTFNKVVQPIYVEQLAPDVEANLALVKSGDSTVIAGNQATYILTVSNAGPSDASSVVLTDTLPVGMSYDSASGDGWSCNRLGQSLSCTRETLGLGTAPQVTIMANVAANVRGLLTNKSRVTSSDDDPDPSDNDSEIDTTVLAQADLRLSQFEDKDPVTAGQAIAYTIEITNTGPSDAWNVTFQDTLPAGVTYVTAFGGGWSCSPSVPVCSRNSLPVNTITQINVVANVNSSALGTLSNVASVFATGSTDPISNNSDTELTTVFTEANLSLAKIATPSTAIAGSVLTYTLTVKNPVGPSDAQSIVMIDTLPTGVTYETYRGDTGWSCNLGTLNQVTCNRNGLASGQTSVVRLRTRVSSSSTGTLANSATLSSTTYDPDTLDNLATLSTTVNTLADLSLKKIDFPDPVAEGQVLTYTLTLTNTGPSDALGVLVTDTLPPQLTILSANSTVGFCTGITTITCDIGGLSTGGKVQIILTARAQQVSGTPVTITNNASVTSSTPDPGPAPNSRSVTTQIKPIADLVLKLTSGKPLVIVKETGGVLTYTMVVTNTGLSAASGVILTDTLPAEIRYTSSTITPSSVSTPLPGMPQTVVWNLTGSIPVRGNRSLMLTVRVTSKTQTLINTAKATSALWDLIPGNNISQASVQARDVITPTVEWAAPFYSANQTNPYQVHIGITQLKSTSQDNVAVDHVTYYRWNRVNAWIEVCTGFVAPNFSCGMPATALLPGLNEMKVAACDTSGICYDPKSSEIPPGKHLRAWFERIVSFMYMPLIKR